MRGLRTSPSCAELLRWSIIDSVTRETLLGVRATFLVALALLLSYRCSSYVTVTMLELCNLHFCLVLYGCATVVIVMLLSLCCDLLL